MKDVFSFSDVLSNKKIQVDFNAHDISSNGGLVLVGLMKDSIARKIICLILDYMNQIFVRYSYEEMLPVCGSDNLRIYKADHTECRLNR